MNTWPSGKREAIHQDQHEQWNAKHYPGTRQICHVCEEPTDRCQEDALWSKEEYPLCERCYLNDLCGGLYREL